MSSFLSGRNFGSTIQTSDIADDAITLAKLANGTANQNIQYNASGVPVDVALPASGKVLQVVQGKLGSNSTVANSVSYATALSQVITLSSTSSKALVTFSLLLHSNDNGSSTTSQNVKLLRDSTVLHSTNDPIIVGLAIAGTGTHNYIWGPYSYTFLDSPNSTSELTYKINHAGADSGEDQAIVFADTTISIMEISS